MSTLIDITEFDSFQRIKNVDARDVRNPAINTIKKLDEKTQLEPFVRACIYDLNDTPHGPVEIVDILTTKITYNNQKKYAAFILKGKSFKRITAQDISHQIYRLKKIDGLDVAILGYTGNILDQPQEEFISTCKEIDCDFSIWNDYDFARLFISEGILCPRDGNIINGNTCKCGYSLDKEELNIFQTEAVKELKKAHALKQTSGLIILPTGSGKTRIAAKDVYHVNPATTIYLAHTNEILIGAYKEFSQLYLEHDLQFLTSLDLEIKKVNFATIQFVAQNLKKIDRLSFKYVIIDEFHHAAAESYLKTINHLQFDFLLGLTATPFRSDRKDIAQLCDKNTIVNYELRDGIETGILSPYHYFRCFDDIDYSLIQNNGISYDIRDLERALVIPERDRAIIKKWREKALNKPTLGFCISIKHAERCCERFNSDNIRSAVYTSETSIEARIELIEKFTKGEIKVLFSVDVLNEGINFPFVECLLFLRPTESKRIFLQQLGRGLRRYQGKSRTIVLDFIGNFANAYKIVEYFGLTPSEDEESHGIISPQTYKEVFNLPLGCDVTFDENVLTVFSQQYYTAENITRHNIFRILTQQYVSLCLKLKHRATWKEVDKYCIIDSTVYKIMFDSLQDLINIVEDVLVRNGV
jgi:superfamily II DNA or RNA helicase